MVLLNLGCTQRHRLERQRTEKRQLEGTPTLRRVSVALDTERAAGLAEAIAMATLMVDAQPPTGNDDDDDYDENDTSISSNDKSNDVRDSQSGTGGGDEAESDGIARETGGVNARAEIEGS